MADVPDVRIDQVVHGYARGHRELAGSLNLDDEARVTMMVMSDLLVDQALDAQSCYLSCYPLRSAARHVLARTWPAGPRFRPGSVWTHSLLIHYQALAQLPDLASLAAYLRRPDGKLEQYGEPIFAEPNAKAETRTFDFMAARTALANIYANRPAQVVRVPDAGEAQNEALALALWRQAWPSLRRDFAFITGVAERGAPLEAGCVLHFTAEPVTPLKLPREIDIFLRDLPDSGPTGLRRFLSRYAVESTAPRSVALDLATIWAKGVSGDLATQIATVAELSRNHTLPRLRRDLILAEFEAPGHLSDLPDLVAAFGSEPIEALPEKVQKRVLTLPQEKLGRLLGYGSSAAEGTLANLLAATIVSGLDPERLAAIADRGRRSDLLRARPELAWIPSFWPGSDQERSDVVSEMPVEIELAIDDASAIFGVTLGVQTARALLTRAIARDPASVMSLIAHENATIRLAAAVVVGGDDETAERALAVIAADQIEALEAIAAARIVSGADLGNPQPWIEAAERILVGEPQKLVSNACGALLVAAAIRLGGKRGLRVAKFVFEPVYTAITTYQLTSDVEKWLERELPEAFRAYSLRSRLAASAVIAWAPTDNCGGALLLCSKLENARDLVTEVEIRFERSALRKAEKDVSLPPAAIIAIDLKLHPPKSLLNWWFSS